MPAWMLGADYLEYIHDALVSLLWPGTEPIGEREQRDRGLIESAAGRPFQTVFGEDAYPTILSKAIALFHSINSNHAFLNGNKRTAVIAIDHSRIANDYVLFLQNDPMYKIAEKTASYKERGLTQEQSLSEITDALKESVIHIDIPRKYVDEHEEFRTLCERFDGVRDWIRAKPYVELRP